MRIIDVTTNIPTSDKFTL